MSKLLKINLSISEFVKTGDFGFLRLGQTKEVIESNKFPPEDWVSKENKKTSPIWRYGNFELHFNKTNELEGIFTDYVSYLDGGESIIIKDWWVIPNGSETTLLRILQELNSMNLDYEKKLKHPGYIDIKLSNGVYFLFDYPDERPNANQNDWTMTVIGKR